MPRDREDAAYVADMLRYAIVTRDLVVGRDYRSFEGDLTLRLAVERAIEIVGEAARKVSDDFERAHPEIPWGKIIAQRHVLAHDYGEVMPDKVWRVATVHIPALIPDLQRILDAARPA